jgi:hypothetical protein
VGHCDAEAGDSHVEVDARRVVHRFGFPPLAGQQPLPFPNRTPMDA